MRRSAIVLALVAALALAAPGGLREPAPAQAGLGSVACKILGTVAEGWWGTACKTALGVGGRLIGGGKKVAKVIGKVASNPLVQRAAGLAAIVAWVLGGAKWTMSHMASAIAHSTSPTLTASWFTHVYLHVEGLAVFFTLLFIFAAAAEAILRSETAVLARAVFVYLPLAAFVTAVAVPVTMLLLAASDELSAGVAQLAGAGITQFLTGSSSWVVAGLTAADPFFAVLAGGLVVAAGGALWVELLIREVAVYVVVALLPVVFAAMVWPARRVWAIRTVEVLIALILSKVAIVAVLALGGAALAHGGTGSLSRTLGGLALVTLGAFSPWVLLRLIPVTEVASAAVGHVRGHIHSTAGVRTPEAALANKTAHRASDVHNGHGTNGTGALAVAELLDQMHHRAQTAEHPASSPPASETTHGELPLGAAAANGRAAGLPLPPADALAPDRDHAAGRMGAGHPVDAPPPPRPTPGTPDAQTPAHPPPVRNQPSVTGDPAPAPPTEPASSAPDREDGRLFSDDDMEREQ